MAGKGGGRKDQAHGRFAFKVLCPEPLVSSVMGRNGATKDTIQTETGCKLVVSDRNEYFPGSRLRTLVIFSDEVTGVLGALDRIVDHIVECGEHDRAKPQNAMDGEAEFLGREPGEYVMRALIPLKASGAIIGPKGANIQAIRDEHNARVFIEKGQEQGHQVLRLIAATENMKMALVRINELVQEEALSAGFAEWSVIRNFGVGGPMPPTTDPGPIRAWEAGRSGRSRSRRRRSRSRDHGARGGGDRPPPGGLGMEQQRQQGPLLMQLATSLSKYPEGTADQEFAITCDLPTSKVSALIGKHGEYVKFVKKTTGAQVHFDEATGESENPMQQMTIKGPLVSCYRAHALMMRKYHESEQPSADVSSLQAHIAELQKQLEMARGKQVLVPPSKGKGKGGKGR